METKNGFFEDAQGNKSSSRLIGVSAVIYALIQSTVILIIGHIDGASVAVSSAASSANFLAIAGPALVYLFNNKTKEIENPDLSSNDTLQK